MFEEMAAQLRQEYGAQRIWLFGSFARNMAGPDSDIDLLIVSPAAEPFFRRMATVQRLLRPYRQGRAISPIVLTPAELEARLARSDQFILDIVSNGVEL
jgi:predicted nucleotidyltransferase